MFSGDPGRRVASGLGMKATQSCYRCFTGSNFQGNTYSPCFDPKLDTETFPATPCPGGIRSSVIFPLLVKPSKKQIDMVIQNSNKLYAAAGMARISTARTTSTMLRTPWADLPPLPSRTASARRLIQSKSHKFIWRYVLPFLTEFSHR